MSAPESEAAPRFEPPADYSLGIADGPLLPGAVTRRLDAETARTVLTGRTGAYALVYSETTPTGQRFAADLALLGLLDQIQVVSTQRGRLRARGEAFEWEPLPAGSLESWLETARGIRFPGLIGEEGVVSNDPYQTIPRLYHALAHPGVELFPNGLEADQRSWTARVFFDLHAAVYRAGFLADQAEYEGEVDRVERLLVDLDRHLGQSAYLLGDRLSDVDVWLFSLLVRFDQVYAPSFRLHRYRIRDFVALDRYLRRLYAIPALQATTSFPAISRGYHLGIPALNRGILPLGPDDHFLR